MSKTYSSAIFELIKSMSKGEKRYFKVFSSRHTIGEENNYIRLFDYIESLADYDEEKLFAHFQGEAFLNKFSITKNRLYENIMRSLDSFHASNSIDAQLYRSIHGADILFKKGLYDHAEKQLKSAEKLARKNDKITILQEINNRQKKIIETFNYSTSDTSIIENIKKNDDELQKRQAYYNNLWNIKSKLFSQLNKKGKARSASEKSCYHELLKDLIQIEQPKVLDFESIYLKNHILSAYHYAVSEDDASLKYLLSNQKMFVEFPERIKKEPNTYFSILTNIIHLLAKSGQYQSAQQFLKELQTFFDKYNVEQNLDMDIKYFSSCSSIELMIYNNSGEFDKAISLEAQIEQGLELHQNLLSATRKAYLSFEMAVACFGAEQYKKGLKWVNQILNDSSLDDKEDIASFAHILNIMIHLELKNERLLPYALRNASRFIKKRARTYEVETILLKGLSKLTKADNPFIAAEIISKLRKHLTEISNNPMERIAFDYFDFETWLEAKEKRIPFKTLKRRKYLETMVAA